MMRRIVALADRRPWVVIWGLVAFVLVVLALSLTFYVRHEQAQTRDQIEQIANQNERITNAFVRGCELAVGNGKEVNLAILDYIRDRQIELGRTGGSKALTDLENIVLQKQNPDTTCVPPPKENP